MKKRGRGLPVFCLSYLAVGLLSLLSYLPFSFLTRLGSWLGGCYFHADGRRKEIGLTNLRLALGKEMPEREIRKTLKASYRQMGSSILEFAALPKMTTDKMRRLIRFDGLEHLAVAGKTGRGIVLLTAHFGNWELLAQSAACSGYPLYVIGRRANVGILHNYIVHCRESHGNHVIVREKAMRRILEVLGEGKILGVLCDQRGSTSRGLMLNFFGHPASTDPDIARLILKTGAIVMTAFGIRNADQTHTVVVNKPLAFAPQGNPKEDALRLTRLYMKELEAMIRSHPEQWLWMHRRWMRRENLPENSGKSG